MLDPLMTLLAAKAKAVGLVAGTALATSALVGGGAVAMTAVSHEGEIEPAVEQVVALPDDGATTTETESDSGTVDIGLPPAPETPELPAEQDVTTDVDQDGLADETGLPVGFVCDDSKNHGQNVSSFAKSNKGPRHGALVAAIARSDCGKGAGDEQAPEETETADTVETQSVETEQARAPKPAKQPKADKPAKQAKVEKPAKSAKADKPARQSKPAKQPKGEKKPAASKGGGKG